MVLNKGAKAPYVVTEEMIKAMRKGTVVVDVSIDQGGCIETSRATTHDNPVFKQHDVTHYCVTNMPGAYPRTSTIALCSETLKYIKLLARSNY
jgi:alanine dehydrogenase